MYDTQRTAKITHNNDADKISVQKIDEQCEHTTIWAKDMALYITLSAITGWHLNSILNGSPHSLNWVTKYTTRASIFRQASRSEWANFLVRGKMVGTPSFGCLGAVCVKIQRIIEYGMILCGILNTFALTLTHSLTQTILNFRYGRAGVSVRVCFRWNWLSALCVISD